MKIFIVGFMGSGKSTLMKEIGIRLNLKQLDLDNLIENRANLNINDIFALKGEKFFRKLEGVCLRELYEYDNFVLASGGGTPCFYDNMLIMNSLGITIWLNTSKEVIKQRLLDEPQLRPLVKNLSPENLEIFIDEKLEERSQFYAQAKIITDPSSESMDELISKIVNNA
ncbi:MAG: shikimate kinase [Chitinophagaceae bacterium]|nr:shikimate kinase [Chitinophagaceae bacterium]